MSDEDILRRACDENWTLLTNDKDFGEQVYRERRPHRGVVLLRLEDERSVNKIEVLDRLLEQYSDRLEENFVVVTESRVRMAQK